MEQFTIVKGKDHQIKVASYFLMSYHLVYYAII